MREHAFAIIGGGLAGLCAAHLLNTDQDDFILIETCDRLGGRMLSGSAADERFVLVCTLARGLPADRLHVNTCVSGMTLLDGGVELDLLHASGRSEVLHAGVVIAAMPPRLLEATIAFKPNQDVRTAQKWRATPTWMGPDESADPPAATPADRVASMPGDEPWVSGPWEDRLVLAGSETSPSEPGYLAGAVAAAKRAVREALSKLG